MKTVYDEAVEEYLEKMKGRSEYDDVIIFSEFVKSKGLDIIEFETLTCPKCNVLYPKYEEIKSTCIQCNFEWDIPYSKFF